MLYHAEAKEWIGLAEVETWEEAIRRPTTPARALAIADTRKIILNYFGLMQGVPLQLQQQQEEADRLSSSLLLVEGRGTDCRAVNVQMGGIRNEDSQSRKLKIIPNTGKW